MFLGRELVAEGVAMRARVPVVWVAEELVVLVAGEVARAELVVFVAEEVARDWVWTLDCLRQEGKQLDLVVILVLGSVCDHSSPPRKGGWPLVLDSQC